MPIPPLDIDSQVMSHLESDAAIEDYMASLFLGAQEFELSGQLVAISNEGAVSGSDCGREVSSELHSNTKTKVDPLLKMTSSLSNTNTKAIELMAATSAETKKLNVDSAKQINTELGTSIRQSLSRETSLPLFAEAIPADSSLTTQQKHELQKLLNQKMLSVSVTDTIIAPIKSSPHTAEIPAIKPDKSGALLQNAGDDQSAENKQAQHYSVVAPSPTESDANNVQESGESNLDFCLNSKANPNYRTHWQNQLPDWGQNGFDALLFKSRGVTLAIPLITLGHIYMQSTPLNQMPNAPIWMIGVKPLLDYALKVIDAGAFFMPERLGRLNRDETYNLLTLANSRWSFAVDSVANPVSIATTDVQWRPLNINNPWFAGTIKQHMCVLIDAPALLKMLPD